jgi:CBS domain-containing protein
MSLDRFCRRPLTTVGPEDLVQRAAEVMREQHVGSVVVADADERPIGVLTDRDVVCRVVGLKLDPARTRVQQVMSEGVGVARKSELVDEVLFRMRQLGVRRLPIVDAAGKAVGIVTLDDLMVLLTAELGQTAAVIRSNRGP